MRYVPKRETYGDNDQESLQQVRWLEGVLPGNALSQICATVFSGESP